MSVNYLIESYHYSGHYLQVNYFWDTEEVMALSGLM
jgi:hypothetical protein